MVKKILYIEDEPDTLDVVCLILKKAGYKITGKKSGTEALYGFFYNQFDLVLLDVMLPDMSGWEVFNKIREQDKKVKIAFLSAIPISDEKLNSLKKEGVYDYILKPFSKDDLVKRIHKILK